MTWHSQPERSAMNRQQTLEFELERSSSIQTIPVEAVVSRLVEALRQLDRFEEAFESIGFQSPFDRVPGFNDARDLLRDLIGDVLGFPADTVLRPDCVEVIRLIENGAATEADLPVDFYCRDQVEDLIFEVVEGKSQLTDLMCLAREEKCERENGGC